MSENSTRTGFEIGKDGVSSIVVGIDGTPPAMHAAAWASGLARRERAHLILTYVEQLTNPAYWTPMGAATAIDSAEDYLNELRAEADKILTPQGISWEVVHHRGDPATALEQLADECHADCIVVGRSRHGGGLLGSVPKALVSRAARPVVVVP